MQKMRTHAGFTLIEIMVVITIMVTLLTISVAGFSYFSYGTGTETSARQVLRALEEAHARTLASDGDTHYGVHFATSTITVFPGDTYSEGSTNNTIYTLQRATITDISLSPNTVDVVFERLRGNASATGTITITQTRDAALTRTILIQHSGLAEVQ